MSHYFIHDGHVEQGPFTLQQLQSQSFTAQTLVWYEGLEKWTTIESLPALKSLLIKKKKRPEVLFMIGGVISAEEVEDSQA